VPQLGLGFVKPVPQFDVGCGGISQQVRKQLRKLFSRLKTSDFCKAKFSVALEVTQPIFCIAPACAGSVLPLSHPQTICEIGHRKRLAATLLTVSYIIPETLLIATVCQL